MEKYTGLTMDDIGRMTQTQIKILAAEGKPEPPGRTTLKNPSPNQLKQLVQQRKKEAGL